MLLSVFPLFLYFGGDFAATVSGAYLAVLLAQALAVAVILYLGSGGRNLLLALAVGLLAVVATSLWSGAPALLAERLTPGNSLRPLRSALPYLAVLVVYWAVLRCHLGSILGLGFTAGLAMMWSNDFALPTAFGCGLAVLYCFWSERSMRFWIRGSAVFALGFLLGLIPLFLVTAGNLPALLAFNFIDVAGDQWWYYGPWSEDTRIFGPIDLRLLLTLDTLPGLALLITVFAGAMLWNDKALLALSWLGLVLLMGGTLASIGGHLGGYFPPFRLWALLTLLALPIGLLYRLPAPRWWRPEIAQLAGLSCLLVAGIVLGLVARAEGKSILRAAKQDSAHFLIPELGGYLNLSWKPYIQLIRQADPADTVFEEYWGIWSAMRRPEPLLPVDSVIHALGRLRSQAQDVIGKHPDWVVTSFPHGWQTWSLTANYWLYRELMEHYEPIITSPATVLWRRQPTELTWESLPCSITPSGDSVAVEANERAYYELELHHRPIPEGRRIALFRNDVTDAFGGWVVLQPGATRSVMPGFSPSAGTHEHPSVLFPMRQAGQIELTGCSARQMSRQDPRLFIYSNVVYPLTETNWHKGFSRHEPVLLVVETAEREEQLIPGARVQLEGHRTVQIQSTESYPPWLHVRYEGERIEPADGQGPVRFSLESSPSEPPDDSLSPGELRPF